MEVDIIKIVEKIVIFIFSSQFLFSISALIIICSSLRKNNNFFDVRKIFRDQIKVFDGSKWQVFLFYGTPMLLSLGTVDIKHIDSDIVSNIIIVLSIMISMIFAMISVLISFEKKSGQHIKVQSETFNTLSFEAILCIFALIISFVVLFVVEIENKCVSYMLSIAIYYLMYTIILNIFIVIKRLKSLFDNR